MIRGSLPPARDCQTELMWRKGRRTGLRTGEEEILGNETSNLPQQLEFHTWAPQSVCSNPRVVSRSFSGLFRARDLFPGLQGSNLGQCNTPVEPSGNNHSLIIQEMITLIRDRRVLWTRLPSCWSSKLGSASLTPSRIRSTPAVTPA